MSCHNLVKNSLESVYLQKLKRPDGITESHDSILSTKTEQIPFEHPLIFRFPLYIWNQAPSCQYIRIISGNHPPLLPNIFGNWKIKGSIFMTVLILVFKSWLLQLMKIFPFSQHAPVFWSFGQNKRPGELGGLLVGGFNSFEKYQSKSESSPRIGVKRQTYFKPTTLDMCQARSTPYIGDKLMVI